MNNNQDQFPNNNNNNNMNNSFLNEFHQLKEYYNFRLKFKKMFINGQSKDSYIKNTFYLIDNNWFQKWKKYVGYDNIREILGKNNYYREISDKDFFWIEPIIKQCSEENIIVPNQKIYCEGNINPLSDFIIIDNKCHDLFNLQTGNILSNEKTYPLKFLKEKIILLLSAKIVLVLFKENNIYFELLLLFDKEGNDKNNILNSIKNINIINWLKENNFDLYSTEELEINEHNYKFRIINKTFKLFKDKIKNVKNNINPQLNDKMNQTLLINNPLSQDMKNKLNDHTILMMKNSNNKYNIINQNNNGNFKPLHRTGLQNVGQSCYMNATIQCLSNINELSNHLLKKYEKQDFNIDTQPLTVAFSSLLFELLNSKDKYIVPSLFKEIIGKLNPLFEGFHAADSKDLIFFIIEKLHKELNKPQQNQNQNHQIDYNQQELESRNEQLMLNKFINDFNTKNISCISKNFYGITQSIMKCENCGVTKHSFQAFNLLIFQLKKVKEQKKKELGDYYNDFVKTLNLYDAFEVEQKEEDLKGENMIHCNNCRKLNNGIHQTKIYGLPGVLIIVLNRGKNNKDFNEEFEIYEKLDFNDRNLISNQNSFKKYYLCGVITHLGESGSSGHFIAYCRNDPNSGFICYNDSIITDVSIKEAISSKISYNDFEKKTPYILIYHHY